MSSEGTLSADQLIGTWKDEFKQVLGEKSRPRCKSWNQVSNYWPKDAMLWSSLRIFYHTVIQALQSSKGETMKLDDKYQEITDLLEEKRSWCNDS